MGTLILKYAAILSLVFVAALRPSFNYNLLLSFVICASGVAVGSQAMRAKRYIWGAVFFSIAVLFNPFFTIRPSEAYFLEICVACILAFVLSLFVLKNIPRKTIVSITEQNSGSDAL